MIQSRIRPGFENQSSIIKHACAATHISLKVLVSKSTGYEMDQQGAAHRRCMLYLETSLSAQGLPCQFIVALGDGKFCSPLPGFLLAVACAGLSAGLNNVQALLVVQSSDRDCCTEQAAYLHAQAGDGCQMMKWELRLTAVSSADSYLASICFWDASTCAQLNI